MTNFLTPANLAPAQIQFPSIFAPLSQPWSTSIPDPIDANDVFRRSAALLFSLNRLEELVARIIPQGFRLGNAYWNDDLLVALDHVIDPRSGITLSPGTWMYESGYFGTDLISLYANIHGVGYGQATSAIFDAYRNGDNDGQKQIKKLPRWYQNIHPLHVQTAEWPVPGAPHPLDVCVFKNAVGQRIAILVRRRTVSGEIANIYHTLWRRNGSYRSHWAAIFPSEAFFLHADVMREFPNNPVHVLLDPFDAKSKTRSGSPWIFTALPAGPSSISDADLSLLCRRDIRVDLDPTAVEGLLMIDRALKSAGVWSATYSLPGKRGDFSDVVGAAAKAESAGFTIKGKTVPDAQRLPNAVVIAGPGQPVPGSEVRRDMLLDPFLKEGYLVWLYAPEKTGKSWLASGIAQTVETGLGTIGKWTPSKRAGVLLVDGEMLPDELDETIRLVSAGLSPKYSTPQFEVLCAKSQPSGRIDIEEEGWQRLIEKRLVGKKLLILDNMQSLMANGGARLNLVLDWLFRITQKGIAVLVLDHTNADGELQGSIAKRRIANVVISMRCEDAEAKANGIATVTYEAARRLHGPDAAPFLLQRVHEGGGVRFEAIGTVTPESTETGVPERIQKMALVVFARRNSIPFREIVDADGQPIPPSTGSDLLKASASLEGEERRQFEAEIARLEAEEHPDPKG